MPSKWYEMRVFKGQREVGIAPRVRDALNADLPDLLNDLLARHLFAAVERQGAHVREAHLFHMTVHEVRGDKAENTVSFTFALPKDVRDVR